MKHFGLYLIITKPTMSYQEIAKIAVRQKVRYLQLREKYLTDRELIAISKEILAITRGTETKFIIDDRVDLAKIVDADGVHLGQTDIPIEEARKILGPDKLYGLSSHSVAQAKEALAKKPDLIGFGPVYPTPTKVIPDPAVGLDYIAEVTKMGEEVGIPVLPIGGIDDTNAEQVVAAGAKNLCLVRFFMETEDLEARIIKIKSYLK